MTRHTIAAVFAVAATLVLTLPAVSRAAREPLDACTERHRFHGRR
jgi:hypothetical protein